MQTHNERKILSDGKTDLSVLIHKYAYEDKLEFNVVLLVVTTDGQLLAVGSAVTSDSWILTTTQDNLRYRALIQLPKTSIPLQRLKSKAGAKTNEELGFYLMLEKFQSTFQNTKFRFKAGGEQYFL